MPTLIRSLDFTTFASGTSGLTANGLVDKTNEGWGIASNLLRAPASSYGLLYDSALGRHTNQVQELYFPGQFVGGSLFGTALRVASNLDHYFCYVYNDGSATPTIGIGFSKIINGSYSSVDGYTAVAGFSTAKNYKLTSSAIQLNGTTTRLTIDLSEVAAGGALTSIASRTYDDSSSPTLQGVGRQGITHVSGPFNFSKVVEYHQDTNLFTPANSASIKTSAYNSEPVNYNSLQSNNTGFYQKFRLTGATTLKLDVDVSALAAQGLTTSQYPSICCIINDKIAFSGQVQEPQITLSSSPGSDSEVFIYFKQVADYSDRWTASGLNSLRLIGYYTDGTIQQSQRIGNQEWIAFGDSLTESVPDNIYGYAPTLFNVLGLEYSTIGFSGQAMVTVSSGYSSTYGSIPGFYQSWNYYRQGAARNYSQPPYGVVINMGTNDNLQSTPDSGAIGTGYVNTAISTFQAMRAAWPGTRIFVLVPFGQFKKSALQQVFQSLNDPLIYLLDCGVEASKGMTGFALGLSIYSSDGIHPTSWNAARLGGMVATKIQAAIATKTKRSPVRV